MNTYVVENMELSPIQTIARLLEGMQIINPGYAMSGYEGGIIMLITVPEEWAEIVEHGSKQVGLLLTPWEADEEVA